MKRRILAVGLAVLMVFTLCSCVFRSEEGEPVTNTLYYGYNNLSVLQQGIYNELLEEAEDKETTFSLFDVSEEDLEIVYEALVYDHPELFWLSDGYEYSLNNYSLFGLIDLNFMEFTVISLDMDQGIDQKISELNNKVDQIVAEANTYTTDYEKVLFVYDYIVENTVYDSQIAEKVTSEETLSTVYNAQTAYGCLVEGKAICSGYSEAFQLLLQKLGIVCGNAFGTDKQDGEQHQWNFAKLDGEYYFFDVTWGDPTASDGGDVEYKSYEFFGITTKELELTHTLEEGTLVPECSETKYNYYHYNGMYADTYSFASTKEIITEQLNNNQFSIKYSTAEECKRAQKDLFDRYKIFSISTTLNEVYYYEGITGCLLIITK